MAGSVAGSVAGSSVIDPVISADSISLSLENSADSADSVCGGLYEVYDRINKIIYCEDLGEL